MFGSTAQQNDLSIKCLPDSTNKEGKVFLNNIFYYLFNITVSFLLVWGIISFLEIGNDFCCQHLSYLHSPSPCSEEVKVTVININFKEQFVYFGFVFANIFCNKHYSICLSKHAINPFTLNQKFDSRYKWKLGKHLIYFHEKSMHCIA